MSGDLVHNLHSQNSSGVWYPMDVRIRFRLYQISMYSKIRLMAPARVLNRSR